MYFPKTYSLIATIHKFITKNCPQMAFFLELPQMALFLPEGSESLTTVTASTSQGRPTLKASAFQDPEISRLTFGKPSPLSTPVSQTTLQPYPREELRRFYFEIQEKN